MEKENQTGGVGGTPLVIPKARDGAESVGSHLRAEGAVPEPTCACGMDGCVGVQSLTHHEY